MNFIVAVDDNWGIGNQGDLLYSIPEDMKFFRQTTLNKVVIMGRNTLESLPGAKPLPKRTNIVLTRNPAYMVEGALVCQSVEEVLDAVKDYPPEDVWVMGGKAVYEALLPYCQKGYITKIHSQKVADTTLVNLDTLPEWECTSISEPHEFEGISFAFCVYENKSCKERGNAV